MTAEVEFRPVAPYLLQSCLGAPDLTRRRFPGGLELVFEAEDSPAYARAWQTRDGRVLARIDAAEEAAPTIGSAKSFGSMPTIGRF